MSDDECQPSTWKASAMVPGGINCRLSTLTGPHVDASACNSIIKKYHIALDTFFELNPRLDNDCKAIQPNIRYCVEGFLEPLRAYNGLCGPDNGNATCVGTDKQCCNKNTWTCGDTVDDCTINCYEGNCY
ncbi:CFEM domain protein [Fusarium beomiforme]|uniref:CFEM domain protein n=1 Tax=Fusarium beomiforme TaxID=44412 RepID=A0A9P5ACX5_9HYPO|nr:CFEM domain protein [Fusarium beomiforme]